MTDPDQHINPSGALELLREAMRASPIAPREIVEFALEVCAGAGFPQTTPELDEKHRALGLLFGKAAPTSADLTHYLWHVADGNIPLGVAGHAFRSMDRLEFRGLVGEQTRAALEAIGADLQAIYGNDIVKNLAVLLRAVARRAVEMTTAGIAEQMAKAIEADLVTIAQAYYGEEAPTGIAAAEIAKFIREARARTAWPDAIAEAYCKATGREKNDWTVLAIAEHITALTGSDKLLAWHQELWSRIVGAPAWLVPEAKFPLTWLELVEAPTIDALRSAAHEAAGLRAEVERVQAEAKVLKPKTDHERDAEAGITPADIYAEQVEQAVNWCANNGGRGLAAELAQDAARALQAKVAPHGVDVLRWTISQALHIGAETAVAWADGEQRRAVERARSEAVKGLEAEHRRQVDVLIGERQTGWNNQEKLIADIVDLRRQTPDPVASCQTCHGRGKVIQRMGFFTTETSCPACRTLAAKDTAPSPDPHGSTKPSPVQDIRVGADEPDMQRIKDLLHERRVRLAARDGEACSWPELVKGLISDHYTGEQNEQVFRSQLASAEQRATANKAKVAELEAQIVGARVASTIESIKAEASAADALRDGWEGHKPTLDAAMRALAVLGWTRDSDPEVWAAALFKHLQDHPGRETRDRRLAALDAAWAKTGYSQPLTVESLKGVLEPSPVRLGLL